MDPARIDLAKNFLTLMREDLKARVGEEEFKQAARQIDEVLPLSKSPNEAPASALKRLLDVAEHDPTLRQLLLIQMALIVLSPSPVAKALLIHEIQNTLAGIPAAEATGWDRRPDVPLETTGFDRAPLWSIQLETLPRFPWVGPATLPLSPQEFLIPSGEGFAWCKPRQNSYIVAEKIAAPPHLAGTAIDEFAVSPIHPTLAAIHLSSSMERTLCIYDLNTRKPIPAAPNGEQGRFIKDLAFGPNGGLFYRKISDSRKRGAKNKICMRQNPQKRHEKVLYSQRLFIERFALDDKSGRMAFSAWVSPGRQDARSKYSLFFGHLGRGWFGRKIMIEAQAPVAGEVARLIFAPDRSILAIESGGVSVFKGQKSSEEPEMHADLFGVPCSYLTFSDEGSILAGSSGSAAMFVNWPSLSQIGTLQFQTQAGAGPEETGHFVRGGEEAVDFVRRDNEVHRVAFIGREQAVVLTSNPCTKEGAVSGWKIPETSSRRIS